MDKPLEKRLDLDRLFRPRSLAIIGVSQDAHKGGGFIWGRVKEQGYEGQKYPIGRSVTEFDGVPCLRSVSEIEGDVDLAIAAVPAAVMENVLADCAQKGIQFVVIHAAGFAELGDEGKNLQKRVLQLARENGMRLVGPNCMGIFCPEVRLNSIVELEAEFARPGGVAFCGQSGWATEHFIVGGSARGLTYSTVISSGNQADLGLIDYISYFGRDPATKVICAYTEGITRGRELLDLAADIGRTKPILIWKAGFSQAGTRAALSHTGSITGKREVWLSAARKAGLVAAQGFDDLVDLAVAFSSPPLPKGRKVAIMAEAGGGGIAASDACEALGLEVKPFSAELRAQLTEFLKKYLPPFSGTSNPLDLVWLPSAGALEVCTRCLELISSEVDSVIFMSYLPFAIPDMRPSCIETLARLRDRLHLPIYVVPPYAARGVAGIREFTEAGIPAFPSFERAARGIAATTAWQAWAGGK
jgi:acetate---CoA ligase (ADP-forming)